MTAVKQEDLNDAIGVFFDMCTYEDKYKIRGMESVDEIRNLLTNIDRTKIEEIPLDKVRIFEDHGRRVSGDDLENPIIVMEEPEGGYITLDGQHRVITKKERGDTKIKALVIRLPWTKGSARRSRFSDYVFQNYYYGKN